MRIEESSDGTIKVVELDPSKRYWFIISANADALATRLTHAKWGVNGQIIRIPPGEKIEIVENTEAAEVAVKCAS